MRRSRKLGPTTRRSSSLAPRRRSPITRHVSSNLVSGRSSTHLDSFSFFLPSTISTTDLRRLHHGLVLDLFYTFWMWGFFVVVVVVDHRLSSTRRNERRRRRNNTRLSLPRKRRTPQISKSSLRRPEVSASRCCDDVRAGASCCACRQCAGVVPTVYRLDAVNLRSVLSAEYYNRFLKRFVLYSFGTSHRSRGDTLSSQH
jgi:hypothetical protein